MDNKQQPPKLFKGINLNVMDLKPLKYTSVVFLVIFNLFNVVQPFLSSYQEEHFLCNSNWALPVF